MITNSTRNIALYKVYRIFGYDYLFYSVISFLFFTQVKLISVAQVMYLLGFAAIFVAIFQIPTNYFVEKLGLKKSMAIGNLLCVLSCTVLILGNDFVIFILVEALCSLGNCFKGLTETQMLYASLKENNKRDKFAKIEGKAVAGYYYVEALAALTVGALFNINNYIPILITLTCLIISFVMSLFFIDVQDKIIKNKSSVKEYLSGFKLVLKSNRIISIFIYAFVLSGVIVVTTILQKSTIVNLDVLVIPYTFIFAIITLAVGIGSRAQYKIEKITKRKTLTIIGYMQTISLILLGMVNIIFGKNDGVIVTSVIILIIVGINQGIYRISIKKYMNNFTTSNIRGKILSVFYIFENIGKSFTLFISGVILDSAGTNLTSVIIGIVSTFILYFILKFMKKRIGLDPQNYSKKDVFGIEV